MSIDKFEFQVTLSQCQLTYVFLPLYQPSQQLLKTIKTVELRIMYTTERNFVFKSKTNYNQIDKCQWKTTINNLYLILCSSCTK